MTDNANNRALLARAKLRRRLARIAAGGSRHSAQHAQSKIDRLTALMNAGMKKPSAKRMRRYHDQLAAWEAQQRMLKTLGLKSR